MKHGCWKREKAPFLLRMQQERDWSIVKRVTRRLHEVFPLQLHLETNPAALALYTKELRSLLEKQGRALPDAQSADIDVTVERPSCPAAIREATESCQQVASQGDQA